ncbi:hypothetical protein ElyMa_003864900 [Elysia marginata]|uniref:Coiled-coil domain-containing protein 86 n=1 Tax=Elysia marginata TaxID=1093978 RepID=A0AAV4FKX8_9GAST|nr:hypothetical protein ElyMa_003864900 [Elysia marginata]
MANRRHGLRPKLPQKRVKPSAKTNAEKCRDYRARLKAEDPEKDEERRRKNHANAKKWQNSLGPEEKERQKELSRQRQQKRRQKLREIKKDSPFPSAKSKPRAQSTPTRSAAKLMVVKAGHKREQARIRQARRREKIRANPQKHSREKEKRRKTYQDKKMFKRLLIEKEKESEKDPGEGIKEEIGLFLSDY